MSGSDAIRSAARRSAEAWAGEPQTREPDGQGASPRSRSTRVLVWAFSLLMLAVIVIVLGLPQLLRTLPDPPPVHIAGLAGQVSGAYVTAPQGGLYKMYAYPEQMKVLPNGAARTTPSPSIVVRARQLDELRRYMIRTYPGDRRVPVSRELIDKHTIRLVPAAALSPGSYCIRASRDSVDAGTDYFYFTVPKERSASGG